MTNHRFVLDPEDYVGPPSHGGNQYVRVEHVHNNDSAQAVIGNVHQHSERRHDNDEREDDSGRN
jgi:hypothetical protein